MKSFLVLMAIFISTQLFADQNIMRSPVNFSCSSDVYSIVGSDGSTRSCWPYMCDSAGNVETSGISCLAYCNGTDMCQPGTVCDTSAARCVSPN